MEKVLKYKEREALNAKAVAQAVIERKGRKPKQPSDYYELFWPKRGSDYHELFWTAVYNIILVLGGLVILLGYILNELAASQHQIVVPIIFLVLLVMLMRRTDAFDS